MNRTLFNYILAGVMIAVLLAGYVIFAFLPLYKKFVERKQAYAAQYKKLEAAQALVGRYDEVMERMGKLQIEMKELEARVPDQARIPELLKDVTRVAARCNLRDFQFAPRPVVAKPEYSVQPVEITITCSYHALGLFVSELAVLPRLIAAREFQIMGRDKTGTTDSISAKMILVTYVRPAH
ncbi:type 4a pilus biogenesis protein PilO [candidate division FCPU426 bacterium]|nr:type 4a pilus biogenesis protein PilO [candidate division FCPU426 bacterium]